MVEFNGTWEGHFQSDMYKIFFGIIRTVKGIVLLDVNAHKATLQYTGYYRMNDITEMTIDLDKLAGTQVGKVVGFKGRSLYSLQEVSFEITRVTHNKVEGTYISSQPTDIGRFWLKKVS